MERRYYELPEMYNNASAAASQRDYRSSCGVKIPPYINDSYCIPEPKRNYEDVLAMAFVEMQPLESVYPEATAFSCGSLFPNLYKPFCGGNRR
ncbi:MAG: spore coat associated protein CotJA [Acutalibacteraceae bacterium]|jgi:hypothetical protein